MHVRVRWRSDEARATRQRRLRWAAGTVMVWVGLVAAMPQAHAGHDVFHIFTPLVEHGEIGTEALSTIQADLPSPDERVRAAHEVAIHAGITDFWMAKLALGLEKPLHEAYDINAVALENVFRLPGLQLGRVDAGWFTGISAAVDGDATNAVEFGPVITVDAGPAAFAFNPFFEKTFGQNREDGIAFSYGWRATYGLADKLSVGLEGYGEIENIADSPAARDQVHRIGPVLYLGHVHGAPHEGGHEHGHGHDEAGGGLHAEIGVLFGLTPATPGTAIKINLGADF